MEQKEKVLNLKRKKKFLGCSLLDHFELGQKVGVGTFGEVLKAKHSNTGKVVALKKIFTKSEQEGFPMTSLREIKLLKNVSHSNVASLIDMAVSYKSQGNVDSSGRSNDLKEVEDVYMVFPFMDHDLTGILENQEISLNLPQIKCYMKQLLEGIAYLHQKQIMHRDMKGANLLVNNRGELKITDFGLARPLEENRAKYTPGVVTRWYRPPELLFGSDVYNESLDIWGIGCIIAEMYTRKPLFGGSSDLEQLKMLCTYCGTPTEENYPGVSSLADYSKLNLKFEKRILREYLLGKRIDREAVDLIDKMLVMDPKQRITAPEALEHEYFKCDPLPCLPNEIEKFSSSHVYTVQQEKEKQQQDLEVKRRRLEQEQIRYNNSNSNFNSSHLKSTNNHHNLPPPPPPPPSDSALDYGANHSSGSNRRFDHKLESERSTSRDGHHRSERGTSRDSHHRSTSNDKYHGYHNESGRYGYRDRRDERGYHGDRRHREERDRNHLNLTDKRIPTEESSHLDPHSPRSNSNSNSTSTSRPESKSPRRTSGPSGSRQTISYDDL